MLQLSSSAQAPATRALMMLRHTANGGWLRHLVISAALLFAAGCATQEVRSPVEQLTAAETALEAAVQAGAEEQAPVEIAKAREHMEKARNADRKEDYRDAIRFSEKARVDAELALAKTEHERAAEALAEVERGIQNLEQEIGNQGQGSQTEQQEIN